MKKKTIKITPPPVKIERKQTQFINLTPEQRREFHTKTSIAYQLLFLADARFSEAEGVLVDHGAWSLDIKKLVNCAQREVKKVTNYIEKQVDQDPNAEHFYNTLNFFDKVLNQLLRSKVNKDDEIKILSYLKNNYHEDIH